MKKWREELSKQSWSATVSSFSEKRNPDDDVKELMIQNGWPDLVKVLGAIILLSKQRVGINVKRGVRQSSWPQGKVHSRHQHAFFYQHPSTLA